MQDDMNSNKNIFYEQQILAMKLTDIFNTEIRKRLMNVNKKIKTVLPTTDKIYMKEIIQEQDPANLGKSTSKHYGTGQKYSCSEYPFNSKNKRKYEYDSGYDYYDNYDGTYEYYRGDYEESELKNGDEGGKKSKLSAAVTDSLNSKPNASSNTESIKLQHDQEKECKTQQDLQSNFSSSSQNKLNKSTFNDTKSLSLIKSLSTPLNFHASNSMSSCDLKKQLYRKRDQSRFTFVESSSANSTKMDEETPEGIFDIIYKRTSRFMFFRNFADSGSNNDCFLFEKELSNLNNSWMQFINKSVKKEKA